MLIPNKTMKMPLTSPWLASAGLTCRFASRILISMGVPLTPLTSLVLVVATTLIQEVTNTWISTQRRRGRTRVISGMRLTFKKSIGWAKWGRKRQNDQDGDVHAVVTISAGMKYKELAERRLNAARAAFEAAALNAARAAFEAAAVELRAAERG